MPLTDKQKIGFAGENAAARFLMKHGFAVLDRNYRKKWGEIDIVAKKEGIIHFVEVKAVSHETNNYDRNGFRPEENVHFWKLKRLSRAIQTYLIEKDVPHETEWQIDVMAVFLDLNRKKATIRITENVII